MSALNVWQNSRVLRLGLALAFGLEKQAGLNKNLVDPRPVLLDCVE